MIKKISIVQLGFLKRQVNHRKLKQWESNLFSVDTISEIPHMPERNQFDDWQYLSDDRIKEVIQHNGNSDFTVAITEYRLENNFYMRSVDNVAVISLYEVGDILQYYHVPIENFIVKNIYEIVTLLHIYPTLPSTRDTMPEIIHDETRSCLFDMNALKTDVVYFFSGRPLLCSQCEAYIARKQLPGDFLKNLVCEIKRIRKPFFYKIYDFVKCHPIWSLLIVVSSQLAIGLLANYLFFLFRG